MGDICSNGTSSSRLTFHCCHFRSLWIQCPFFYRCMAQWVTCKISSSRIFPFRAVCLRSSQHLPSLLATDLVYVSHRPQHTHTSTCVRPLAPLLQLRFGSNFTLQASALSPRRPSGLFPNPKPHRSIPNHHHKYVPLQMFGNQLFVSSVCPHVVT